MSEEQILHIIKCQGWFEVSWRYREKYLRRKLKKMAEKKKILQVNLNQGGRYVYECPIEKKWTYFYNEINGK